MTATQLALDDCDPDWPTLDQPADDTPTPGELRAAELHDLRYQRAGFAALWMAHNVPTGSYL